MRKSAFCIYAKTKHRSATQQQRIWFRYIDVFCSSIAQFVSDLVGNPEDRFSHYAALTSDVVVVFSRIFIVRISNGYIRPQTHRETPQLRMPNHGHRPLINLQIILSISKWSRYL